MTSHPLREMDGVRDAIPQLALLEYWKNILITNQHIFRLSSQHYTKWNFILILLYCITSGIGGVTTIASFIVNTLHIPDYIITTLFAFSVVASSCMGLALYKLDLSSKASRCLETSRTCATIIREIELQSTMGISDDEIKGMARMFKTMIDITANRADDVPHSISMRANELHNHHNMVLDAFNGKGYHQGDALVHTM